MDPHKAAAMTLLSKLRQGLAQRSDAIQEWNAEGSDSYRVFHGVAEGRPGLTLDRYGDLLLVQVAASGPLDSEESADLEVFLDDLGGPSVVAFRQGSKLVLDRESQPGLWSSTFWCRELGLEFAIELAKAHRDPQLFLDFRAAKRELKAALAELGTDTTSPSVLNLFAYTCSVSCHAAAAGAGEVWSADFSVGNLTWGQKNWKRNRLEASRARFLELDCIGLLWALTGNHKALARGRRAKPKVEPRSFSVVVVDPPAFSKGKFAAVDLVRDPETVFGPAWDAVAPGGLLLAANNSAKVTRSEFQERLVKLFDKRQKGSCLSMRWLTPDSDFPSFDGESPLKVVFCRKV